ncbi:MAG: carboxypeptidase-like regulatory domain-containing protein, partial [Planctomycetota bacterium]
MRIPLALLVLLAASPAFAAVLTVEVTVPGADGDPAPGAGALVSVHPAARPVLVAVDRRKAAATVADEHGRVALAAPSEPSIVVVTKDGLAAAWARVEPGPRLVPIALRAAVSLSGAARYPDGDPLPGATITISAERTVDRPAFLRAGEVGFTTGSDEEGRFTFPGLVPGRRYRLVAVADDAAPGILRDATAGGDDVEVRARAGSTVSGHVFRLPGGQPLAGAKVRIGPRETETDEKGEFRAVAVPEGDVAVDVTSPGCLFTGP